jgi:hypothetical protein
VSRAEYNTSRQRSIAKVYIGKFIYIFETFEALKARLICSGGGERDSVPRPPNHTHGVSAASSVEKSCPVSGGVESGDEGPSQWVDEISASRDGRVRRAAGEQATLKPDTHSVS